MPLGTLGTDYATLVVRSLIASSVNASLSICVLFLDLVAAYDSVIREIAIGFPHNVKVDEKREYLLSIGIPLNVSNDIIEYLDANGPVFEQVGTHAKISRMLNVLHTKCWSSYGSLQSVIVGSRGGRQGCKLGGVLFTANYAVAVKEVRATLSAKGIAMKFKLLVDSPFWAFNPDVDQFDLHEVVEVSFVDDTALPVDAPASELLDKAGAVACVCASLFSNASI